MPHYQYLIVGGGMTADAAVRGIRETDASGKIGLIGAETEGPYNRPPLSKGLWKGRPLDKVWRGTAARQVDLWLDRRAVGLDLASRTVSDDQGATYTYDRLLLATGGTPRRLPFGGDAIIYYRTLEDYRRLRNLADRSERFLVIGGGFIGTEIAAALAMNGRHVTMVFPEECLGGRAFPQDLAQFVQDYYQQKGVQVMSGWTITGIEQHGQQIVARAKQLSGGEERTLEVDGVVAGLGIQPNVDLAQAAGLAVDNGIVVDERLRAGREEVFAAGDVANFYNPVLGRRLRVEHEDNANTMGLAAGRAMAGQDIQYDHLPFFYSDLFDLGYEAVGEIDSRLETVADWQEPYHKGVIYYLANGRVRGVLLWNVWGQIEAARALMAERGPFDATILKGRLPAG